MKLGKLIMSTGLQVTETNPASLLGLRMMRSFSLRQLLVLYKRWALISKDFSEVSKNKRINQSTSTTSQLIRMTSPICLLPLPKAETSSARVSAEPSLPFIFGMLKPWNQLVNLVLVGLQKEWLLSRSAHAAGMWLCAIWVMIIPWAFTISTRRKPLFQFQLELIKLRIFSGPRNKTIWDLLLWQLGPCNSGTLLTRQKSFLRMEPLVKNTHRPNSIAVHLMKTDLPTVEVPMVQSIAGIREENSGWSWKLIKANALLLSAIRTTWSQLARMLRLPFTLLKEASLNSLDKLICLSSIMLRALMFLMAKF